MFQVLVSYGRQNKQDRVHFFHEDYDAIKQKNFTSIQLRLENTKGDGFPDISGKRVSEVKNEVQVSVP